MKLKITMRQSAPDAEVVASTTQSNKRKCQEIEEPNENPSRPAKPRRIAKLHKTNAEPSALEKLPSEIQYLIYTSLFQFTKDKGQFPRSESPPSTVVTGPSKGSSSNVTSILRVSKKTNLEAAQAFHDTFTRPVNLWRSNIREAINRATNETNNRRVTRGQDAVNLELQSVLRHRHITINVQLEFDEDCDSLYQFKTLLTESRDHLITLNLNLGFIDSHGPFEENGLVFKEEDEDMEELVTELISWKDPRCTVNMSYMTGCICGGNDLVPSIKYALEHLTEVTEANDINFTHTKDFPKGWPRWIVQSNRLASWNWSRSRAIRRMDIDSA